MQTQTQTQRPVTFDQWKQESIALNERASAVSRSICDRAKALFDAAHGGNSEAYICFHYSHNWQNQAQFTPEQQAAMREVIRLGHLSWEPHRVSSRLATKRYKRIQDAGGFRRTGT